MTAKQDNEALLKLLQDQLNKAQAPPTASPDTNGMPISAMQPASQRDPSTDRPLAAEIDIIADGPAESTFDRMRELYAVAVAAHKEIQHAVNVMLQNMGKLTRIEQADCVLALRESAALLDDSRKAVSDAKRKTETLICVSVALDPRFTGTFKASHCTAIPTTKLRYQIPTFEKDPETYTAMMDWLEVREDLRDSGKILVHEGEYQSEVLEPSFKGLQDMMDMYAIQGYAVPDWAKDVKTWNEYVVEVRKTKDLL